jgi:valyl-tRNA synthetase
VNSRTAADQRRRALQPAVPMTNASLADRWIASRLSYVTAEMTRLLGEFNFGEAGRVIHDFIWDELADWYVEAYKILSTSGQAEGTLLTQVYEKTLRLLHPFAPFATEELWQRLTTGCAERPIALIAAEWPRPADRDVEAEEQWSDVMALTRAARALRADYHIETSNTLPATIRVANASLGDMWRAQLQLIGALPGTRLAPIEIVDASASDSATLTSRSIAAVAGGAELLIPAEGLFDVQSELRRTEQELADAAKQVQRLEGLLGSEFVRKAPPETVERERERLTEQRERRGTLERRRDTLTRLNDSRNA